MEEKYEGFYMDQMQRIQNFRREKITHLIPCIWDWQDLPKNLEVFSRKVSWWRFFLSKIDKHLIDLTMPKMIMDYNFRTTLVEAFGGFLGWGCHLFAKVAPTGDFKNISKFLPLSWQGGKWTSRPFIFFKKIFLKFFMSILSSYIKHVQLSCVAHIN